MKHLTSLAVIVLTIAALGCDTLRTAVWPTTVQCGLQEASDAFTQVRGVVEQDGFSPEFSGASERALEDLAIKHGASVVACILHALIDKYTPRGIRAAEAEGDYESARRSQRVQLFLASKQVEVQVAQ